MKHTDNLTSSGRYVRTSADDKDTVKIEEGEHGLMILIRRAGQSFEMYIPHQLIPEDFVRIPKKLAEAITTAISDVRKDAAKPSKSGQNKWEGNLCIDCGTGKLGPRVWVVKPSETGKTQSAHICSHCDGYYGIEFHEENQFNSPF